MRDSDATLIITPETELTGGSLFTQECAKNLDRPYLHVYPSDEWREWIRTFSKEPHSDIECGRTAQLKRKTSNHLSMRCWMKHSGPVESS